MTLLDRRSNDLSLLRPSIKHHCACAECVTCKHEPDAAGVRTIIALHHGRKTKSESFASCRDRVNISGGSKIASITVKCKGDSLSVTVPLKVKKCLRACVTPVIPPWQIGFSQATDGTQKELKLQSCLGIYSFGSNYTYSRWLCE